MNHELHQSYLKKCISKAKSFILYLIQNKCFFAAVTLLSAWKLQQSLKAASLICAVNRERQHSYIKTTHNKEITWKAHAA